MTAVRSFRGLGCPQQAFGIFARCAAQNTMLVIFVALWRIFFPPELISLLRLSMLRQRIRGANATSLTAASVGGISLTLQRDAIYIITLEIVNWYLFLLRYGAYFFRLSLSLCSGFRCSVSEFVERMRHLSPPLRSAVSRSRSSVMLSISSLLKL